MLFCFSKLSFTVHETNVLVRGQCYRQIKVNKINFFLCLLSHSWDLGFTGSDTGLSPHDSTHGHN